MKDRETGMGRTGYITADRIGARTVQVCRHLYRTLVAACMVVSCSIEPPLHTLEPEVMLEHPIVELELNVLWDYLFEYDTEYDWRAEWLYGWDERDEELFGPLGYTEPKVFEVRRYFTGDIPNGRHNAPLRDQIAGNSLCSRFDFGFWDILAWNQIQTQDGIQSVRIDETSTYEYVTASTGQTMNPARYNAPRYMRSFYQPEELFSDYMQAVEINRSLDGFVYDENRNVWVRKMEMLMLPLTYIYLPQVVLHNNRTNGRKVTDVDGNANLSSMARYVRMNDGVTGDDPITVYCNTRMKYGLTDRNGGDVDVIGGKLMTFGITNLNPGRLDTRSYAESMAKVAEADKGNRHYLDVTMIFSNGADSTLVFDVTDQVRRLFRGGVITVELDMDTVPIPRRSGGSGFDATVEDNEEEEWEFDM